VIREAYTEIRRNANIVYILVFLKWFGNKLVQMELILPMFHILTDWQAGNLLPFDMLVQHEYY
jgi:hypothetical protein